MCGVPLPGRPHGGGAGRGSRGRGAGVPGPGRRAEPGCPARLPRPVIRRLRLLEERAKPGVLFGLFSPELPLIGTEPLTVPFWGVSLGLAAARVPEAGPRGLANCGAAFPSFLENNKQTKNPKLYLHSMCSRLPFNFAFSGDSRNTEFSPRCCSLWVKASARGPGALCP